VQNVGNLICRACSYWYLRCDSYYPIASCDGRESFCEPRWRSFGGCRIL